MKVKFLRMLDDEPWAEVFYRCGHCSSPVGSKFLESHAKDAHGIDDIEIVTL